LICVGAAQRAKKFLFLGKKKSGKVRERGAVRKGREKKASEKRNTQKFRSEGGCLSKKATKGEKTGGGGGHEDKSR